MKMEELKRILEKRNLNAALFYSLSMNPNPNVVYFAQYYGVGALIVPKSQKPFLIVPEMEYERAKKSMIKNVYGMDKKKFFESVRLEFKERGVKAKNIGIDKSAFTLLAYKNFKKQFKSIKTEDIALDCLKLREIKAESEIRKIKKAFNYANAIIKRLLASFKDFKTESQAAAFLEYESKKLGLGMSFPPIIASGKNASMPHHMPQNTRMQKGFCVVDFGIRYKGYCTDITRTVFIGRPSKKEKGIYGFLLDAQKDIINGIRANDNCGKIYDRCVKKLGNYAKYFTHGLGHGVGIEIHELPNLTLNSKDRLKENMVFTIEPGIYMHGKLGIRIEDTIALRKAPEMLTKVQKELMVI